MAMAANYLPYERGQMLLLPEAIQDWLPEGHLAYFISDTLDLGAVHARYDKDGPRNHPSHPAMMLKVLVYGYATGEFSSRKIARKLHENVASRVLAAGNFPAHRAIRDFRAFHLKELSELFVQVIRLARETGPVKLGTIAEEGTKVSLGELSKQAPADTGYRSEAVLEQPGLHVTNKLSVKPVPDLDQWISCTRWTSTANGGVASVDGCGLGRAGLSQSVSTKAPANAAHKQR